MNSIQGKISNIQSEGNLSIVSVTVSDALILKAIVIENSNTADYLRIDKPIRMLFKETEVAIAFPDQTGISLQNKIPARVKSIEKGVLLSKLELQTEVGPVCSIISTSAVESMHIKPEAQVIAMVKLNEVMLSDL